MKSSVFIQEVEAYAQQMAERLPKTNEGSMIIMAIDDNEIATCLLARPSDRKKMLKALLGDADVRESIQSIIADAQKTHTNSCDSQPPES